MNVALDIDGTISEHPEFFAVISTALRAAGHRVVVLTFRDPADRVATLTHLTDWGVQFDDLVHAPTREDKGRICGQLGIELFFEDEDECIIGVPADVLVCKVRNGGNFNFMTQRWVSTSRLTQLLH
jgi:hypothetical protein